ncbi:MAG: hypothetical protein PGN07_08595 [Aeromicrobium erythreum]
MSPLLRRLAPFVAVALVAGLQAAPADAATKRSLSLKAGASAVTVSSTVSFSGTLSRSPKGTTVTLQRLSGSRWVKAAATRTTSSKGGYKLSVRMPSTGSKATFRASVAKTKKLRAAVSSTRTVALRPQATGPSPEITTEQTLPVTSIGATYNEQLTADLGPGTWRLAARSLPAGLSLSPSGVISGTPTTAGTSLFTVAYRVTATNAEGTADLVLEVRASNIATKNLPTAEAGQPYSFQLRTNGTVAGTWSTQGGTPLPANLTLDADGLLHGTPTQPTGNDPVPLFLQFTRAGTSTVQTLTPFLEVEPGGAFTPSTTTIAVGSQSACRIDGSGTSSCWGFDFKEHFGIGIDYDPRFTYASPTPGPTGPWSKIADATFTHSCAVKSDASLWCMGENGYGQLGDGSGYSHRDPTRVGGTGTGAPTAWRDVAVSDLHSCGISTSDELWCWGFAGWTGDPNQTDDAETPIKVGTGYRSLATGGASCAIRTDRTLWCWSFGQAPAQVGTATWSSVAQRSRNTCGIRTDGSLWCWGDNDQGQLGVGTTTRSDDPVRVGSRSDWSTVSVGGTTYGFACATTTTGEAWCWGRGTEGQLGDGAATSSLHPVRVDATRSWSSIGAGRDFACGVKSDGSQRCWGRGGNGQLGDGQSRDSDVPVTVTATKPR